MSILLISDDDRSALACELLAQQLRQRGQHCLTLGLPAPAASLHAAHSPLPPSQPQITMALDALVGSRLLEQACSRSLLPTRASSAIVIWGWEGGKGLWAACRDAAGAGSPRVRQCCPR